MDILKSVGGWAKQLTDGADHYHADYIDPFWNDSMVLITTIGNHKFYKDIR